MKRVKDVKTSRSTTVAACFFTTLAACVFTSLTLFTSFLSLSAQQTPTFRTRTDLVELDISVLDKDRRPVRGLTKADFTVFEGGRPQEISIFEAIDVPDAEPPAVAWMRDVTPDVTTNETRITRLWVLVIDDALIPQDPWMIQSSRKIVRDIIDKFGPEDLVAIVYTADSRQAQDFTNDRTKLLATLDKFSPGLATWRQPELALPSEVTPPRSVFLTGEARKQDPQFWLGSVHTVLNVVDAFSRMPNTRKAVIWVTPGVPMNAFATIKDEVHVRLKDLTQEIFAVARRANVPIYPIDPCGLFGLKGYVTGGSMAAPDKPEMPWVRAMDHVTMTAANTGGRPVVNTNDFAPGINSIFEENKSYYLVGYNPTNTKPDGALRRLEVKVNRNDVEVRTRSSYLAPKPGDGPPKSTNETLARAIAVPVPVSELPLRATVAPFAIPGERNAAVAIALGVRQPVPESAAKERVTVTTELRVTAFTTEGDNKGTQRHTAKVVLRAGAQGDADYEALSRIDLAPGRYRLRLAAHHEAAGKTGTVMVDVVVPDFNRDPASISGVILTATPGRPSAPRDLFRDILPIIPTAQRTFSKAGRATALFYVYQDAGRPMAAARVGVRITDVRGETPITDSHALGVDKFVIAEAAARLGPPRNLPPGRTAQTDAFANKALRAAEVQYQLPLDRLSDGSYLLTFEVTVGATVLRRDVQFQVK